MKQGPYRIACIGGIETSSNHAAAIKPEAYRQLGELGPGHLHLLITHDAPYGIATSFTGETQGSRLITALIEQTKPQYIISGHYHHMNGPKLFGTTTYFGLNLLIPPVRKDPLRRVQSGSLAVLDSSNGQLEFVVDEWMSDITSHLQFIPYVDQLKSRLNPPQA